MRLIRLIWSESGGEDWSDGFVWLAWTILCGLLPLTWALLDQLVEEQRFSILALTTNGEFALYSASYLGGSLYLVVKDFRRAAFPSRGFTSAILAATLIFSVYLFTSDAPKEMSQKALIHPPYGRNWIEFFSSLILPLSIFFSLLVMIADNVIERPDLRDERKNRQEALAEDFDNLGEEDE